jgi:hypothetical protein
MMTSLGLASKPSLSELALRPFLHSEIFDSFSLIELTAIRSKPSFKTLLPKKKDQHLAMPIFNGFADPVNKRPVFLA